MRRLFAAFPRPLCEDILMHKAAGIIIKDRSLLILRSKGTKIYFAPGGKLKFKESAEEALIRELKEEVSIYVQYRDIKFFGQYEAPAAGDERVQLRMDVFKVEKYDGEIVASNEIEVIAWINSTNIDNFEIGSIFKRQIFPRLKSIGAIL